MYYIKRLYIFFSTLALIIFFFSTEAVKAKSFEINDIEIAQPFEINFDKSKVIDLGFKKAFFELVYSLIKSPDFKKIDNIRLNEIGFVFQFHRLLPEFSALENVMVPQMLNGLDKLEAADRADQLLAMVGLRDRADHRPGLLSGGEQQRVAIARAVANAPRVLLADEPTGNLDPDTAKDVFGHLAAITRATQTAALVVTHNQQLALNMDSILTIENGHVVELA